VAQEIKTGLKLGENFIGRFTQWNLVGFGGMYLGV